MRRAVIIFLLCCSPAGVIAQTTAQARKEILQLEDRWREAQHQNDKTAYDQLLSSDLTFIGTSGSIRDKTGFIASRKDSWIPRAESYTYSEMTVRFYGSAAIVSSSQDTLKDSSATLLSAIILTFLSSVFSRPKNLAISMI